MSTRILCMVIVTFFVASKIQATLHAEHRVALLIGNERYADEALKPVNLEMNALRTTLENSGFRCEVLLNKTGAELRRAVEDFVSRTPVHGTALVYYRGYLLPGDYKGQRGAFLAGVDAVRNDARKAGSGGVRLQNVLDQLNARGGSSQNLVIVSDASGATWNAKAPTRSMLGFTTQPLSKVIAAKKNLQAAIDSLQNRQGTWPVDVDLAHPGSVAISSPQRLIPGRNAGDEWVNARGAVFCWCPAGRFAMGSPRDEEGRYADETQHQETIAKGFWISKYELTLHENLRNTPRETLATHKNHPLTMLNHDDAKRMLQQTLNMQEQKQGRLPDGWEYGLPSSVEWEYAARAGTSTAFSFGDDLNQLSAAGNFADKSYYDTQSVLSNYADRKLSDGAPKIAIVGQYKANPWGLHDVHGNVAEWCIDTTIRGGSWGSKPGHCRSAYRDKFSSRNQQNFIGYRTVIRQK